MASARWAFASWTVFAFARVACVPRSDRLNATNDAELTAPYGHARTKTRGRLER